MTLKARGHRLVRSSRLWAALALVTLAGAGVAAIPASSGAPAQFLATADGTRVDARTIASPATVHPVGFQGVTKVRFYDASGKTTYLGQSKSAPFSFTFTGSGARTVQVRVSSASGELGRFETSFVLGSTGGAVTPVPSATTQAPSTSPTPPTKTPTATNSPTATSTPAPTATFTNGPGRTVNVSTAAQLSSALSGAQAGDTIVLANGTYLNDGGDRWVAAANGTAAKPITLRGGRGARLESDSVSGDYGLHITGDQWRVQGLTVANATKGIVLDGSVGTVIDGVEVANIGDEGVHFRSCSSDGVLRNSLVRDTGKNKPQFGEGVYVGSANSNWSKYSCTDGRDNSERVLIEGNTFRNISAEGADLKEGTESGTLRNNVFDNAGFSGENSADSAVDAKGNNWVISGNTVRNASGSFLDAFQTHNVFDGYGTGNVFRANKVEGSINGFGFGLYPKAGNTVSCDNTASGAKAGLVGDNSKASACG